MLHPTCVFASSPEVLHPREPEAVTEGNRGTGSPWGVGDGTVSPPTP